MKNMERRIKYLDAIQNGAKGKVPDDAELYASLALVIAKIDMTSVRLYNIEDYGIQQVKQTKVLSESNRTDKQTLRRRSK